MEGQFVARLPTPLGTADGLPLLIDEKGFLPIARLPSAGEGDDRASAWYFADSGPPGIDPHRSFRVRPENTAALAAAHPGTYVTIFGVRGWQDYVLPVKEVDVANRVITLDGTTWDTIGEGSRFAVLNADATPETWRYDPATGTIRRLAGGTVSPSAIVVAATLPCIISITGADDVTLVGLRLVGSATEGAGVCLLKTRHVTLQAIGIADVGDGVRLDHAIDSHISGTEIAQTGGFGIKLNRGSNGTVVTESWLHDIGWLHQDASAIWFDGSSRNLFARNRIESVAKFGIGGGSLGEGGAYDNVIEYNEIYHANQRTSDGGGILMIGWAQDAMYGLIQGNFVSGTTAFGNMGWDGKPHTTFQDPVTRLVSEAIYLDDWASAVLVKGNLLCGNVGGMELHAGWDNVVSDNVLIGNAGIAVGIDAENWLGSGAHPHAMERNSIERNAVFLYRPSNGQSGIAAVRGGLGVAAFDNNSYAGPGLNDYSFHHVPDDVWPYYSFGLGVWRLRGQDLHSTTGVASALPVLQDTELRIIGPTSPPAPIPLSRIGRHEDSDGLEDRVRQRCGVP